MVGIDSNICFHTDNWVKFLRIKGDIEHRKRKQLHQSQFHSTQKPQRNPYDSKDSNNFGLINWISINDCPGLFFLFAYPRSKGSYSPTPQKMSQNNHV